MKIYVASSWRNAEQPHVVECLRGMGHEVYDFRNPAPGKYGFAWSQIDPNWKEWSVYSYLKALEHPLAVEGFNSDMAALKAADVVVLVLPCGRSAHLEAGWAAGAGKHLVVHMPKPQEPDLMYKMGTVCSGITQIDDYLELLEGLQMGKDKPYVD